MGQLFHQEFHSLPSKGRWFKLRSIPVLPRRVHLYIGLKFKGRPCHSWGSQLSASHSEWTGSISDKFMWLLWWIKWHWGPFPPRTSVSPANSHSTKCPVLITVRDLRREPNRSRRSKWIQPHSTPWNFKNGLTDLEAKGIFRLPRSIALPLRLCCITFLSICSQSPVRWSGTSIQL
jgi:hypothetical protein